jgi:molecular chaperone DnaK
LPGRDASLKSDVEEKVKSVREALESDDVDRIRPALDALMTSMQHIGEAVYGAPAGATGEPGGAEPGEGAAEEGTVEGEFREV